MMNADMRNKNSVLTTADYVLSLSPLSPYRRVPSMPFYVNFKELGRLVRAREFLREYEKAPDPVSPVNEADLMSRYMSVYHRSGKQWNEDVISISDLVSDCVLLSELSAEPGETKPGAFCLPVERFYGLGNPGSGRHVRFSDIELKGSGRNRCSLREDWLHAWGGMELMEVLSELFLSKSIDAISPMGAVPLVFGALYQRQSRPAVIKRPPGGADRSPILLSTLARSASYTRLANICEHPFCPPPSTAELPSMDAIVEQYAALTAYGHFHCMPTPDNLTLEGLILDASSSFVTDKEHFPRLVMSVSDRRRSRITKNTPASQLLRYIAHTPLYEACSSASYIYALLSISALRERIGASSLRSNWEDNYLRAIAKNWLFKKGFGVEISIEHSRALSDCFSSQLDAMALDITEYFKKVPLIVERLEEGERATRISLRQASPINEGLLRAFLKKQAKHRCQLINRYNSRNRHHMTGSGKLLKLIFSQKNELFSQGNYLLNTAIMKSRMYNPCCVESLSRQVRSGASQSKYELYFDELSQAMQFGALSGSTPDLHVSICALSSDGRLLRRSLAASLSSEGCLIIDKADLPGVALLEGVTQGSTQACLPLPVTMLGSMHGHNI